MGKSSTGLDENVAGLLCYVLGWISGLVFVLLEQESKFVRFHAMQSIYVFGILNLVIIIIGWIPLIGWVISTLIGVVAFALWVVLMIKAYQGAQFKIKWAGDYAERWVSRQSK
jgi:uncharacterized membrane protein